MISLRHIQNIFSLKEQDLPLLIKLKDVGIQVLKDMGYKMSEITLGFHIPPLNSVQHLHMHAAGKVFEK